MLTVILGRVGDGKTAYVIKRVGQLIQKGKRSIVIVPDQATYAMEKSICQSVESEGFSLCSVMSFNRFCFKTAASAGVKCPQRLSDSGRLMLIENAVSLHKDELTVYKRSCKKSGFAQRMERMLALLKSCCISPEQLVIMAQGMPESMLKHKLCDTAVIYREYQRLAGADYCDNNDLFALAAANADAPLIRGCEIFVDGFDTLTGQMLWLLQKLIVKNDVTVTLAMNEESPWLYSGQMHTLSQLEQAASFGGGAMRTIQLPKRVRDNAFDGLHNLYSMVKADLSNQKSGGIDLFVAKSIEQEISQVAFSIRNKLKNGARYRDFAVACVDASLISTVERIFASFGMPVFCDTARSMLSQPAVELIISALDACRNHYQSQISDYLSNYLCPLPFDDCERLRLLISELGLTNKEVIEGCDRINQDAKEQLDRLREGLKPLLKLKARLEECNGAGDFAAAVWEFMMGTEVSQKLSMLINRCRANNMLAEADEYKQVWDNMVAQLEQINMLMAKNDQEADVDLYIDMLKRGFESQDCFVLPSTVDLITVGDPERSRFDGIKELYVVGAADGYFPAVASGEGLLSPGELKYINREDKVLTPDMGDSSVRSLFRLFSTLLAPSKLHISYSLKKGRVAQEAGHLLKLIKEVCVVDEVLTSPKDIELASVSGATEHIASCKGALDADAWAALQALKKVGSYDKNSFEFLSDVPTDAKALYGDTPISMSKLETQAKCPLKNLLTGGLRLKENKTYDSDSADIGEIMHYTLEHSVAELMQIEEKKDIDAAIPDVVRKNLYTAARTIHDGVMQHTARAKLLCDRLNKSVTDACFEIMDDVDVFRPYAYEVSFGMEGKKPIRVETANGSVKLRGKIDRVDMTADKALLRIVDYKSSEHKINRDSITAGTTLQLPLYMLAMEQQTGAEGVAMYYRNCFVRGNVCGITCHESDKKAISKQEFRDLLEQSKLTAVRLAADMLAGSSVCASAGSRIGQGSPCDFCPHKNACFARINDRK